MYNNGVFKCPVAANSPVLRALVALHFPRLAKQSISTVKHSTALLDSNRTTFAKRPARAIGSRASKKRGGDSLYATNIAIQIDDDIREEYWTVIRKQPDRAKETETL